MTSKKSKNYCCDTMKFYLEYKCDEHSDPHDCSDYVIAKFGKKLGIPIRDGGSSFTEIKFCPWCGADLNLKKKKKDDLLLKKICFWTLEGKKGNKIVFPQFSIRLIDPPKKIISKEGETIPTGEGEIDFDLMNTDYYISKLEKADSIILRRYSGYQNLSEIWTFKKCNVKLTNKIEDYDGEYFAAGSFSYNSVTYEEDPQEKE